MKTPKSKRPRGATGRKAESAESRRKLAEARKHIANLEKELATYKQYAMAWVKQQMPEKRLRKLFKNANKEKGVPLSTFFGRLEQLARGNGHA